jgi:hypothetical protein
VEWPCVFPTRVLIFFFSNARESKEASKAVKEDASVKKQVYLGSWKEGLWSLCGARGRNRGGDWGLRISCWVAEEAREIFFLTDWRVAGRQGY